VSIRHRAVDRNDRAAVPATRDALLVGPGYGWSGFIATTAERCAPSTL